MVKTFVGYHGTDKIAAQSIIDTKTFLCSVGLDEWLGQGVYFFIDSDDAHWWCTDYHRLTCYTVITASLVSSKIVDFVHCRKDQLAFKSFCDLVANRSAKLPNGSMRRNYMSLALKIMIAQDPPDIIIGGFNENRNFWFNKEGMQKKFPLVLSQVQLCVLNRSCIEKITTFEEVG